MKDRIIFLLWLGILAVLWIPGHLDGAGALLAASLAGALVLIILAAVQSKTLAVYSGLQAGDGGCILMLETSGVGILPVRMELTFTAENRLTGDSESRTVTWMAGRNQAPFEVWISQSYCGRIKVRSKSIKAGDLLGLMRFRTKSRISSSCLLLPPQTAAEIGNSLPYYYDMNSDLYSELHAGDDLSEVFDIREYQDGDRIKAIHWKMSARTGDLMVREGSYPVNNRVLFLLENGYSLGDRKLEKESLQQACSILLSLSESMMDKGIPHHMGWWREDEQRVEIVHMDSPDRLLESLGSILSATLEPRKQSILEKYYEENMSEEFSFILVIDNEFREKQLLEN